MDCDKRLSYFFMMKKLGDAIGDLDSQLLRFSSRKSPIALFNQSKGVGLGAEHLTVGDKFYGMVPLLPVWELIEGFLVKHL